MHTKSLGLGVAVALLAVVVVVGMSGAADGRPLSGAELYRQLADAARAGDAQAAEYKGLLDEHLRRGGLRATGLSLPAEATSTAQLGEVHLIVRNSAPWGITIANATVIDTPDAIAQYREQRHAAVAALAATDGGREIAVVASPARSIGLQEFAGMLVCPCSAEQIVVDIYDGAGGWLMGAVRDISGLDLQADISAIEAAVLEQAAVSVDHFPGVEAAELSTKLRSVRLSLKAENALEVSRHPDILIVDPLTDIADTYAGQAALISVESPPDAWEAYARLVLDKPVDANFVGPVGE
jgi:hypothetical protein